MHPSGGIVDLGLPTVRAAEDEDARTTSGWAVQFCLWSLNPAVAFKELTDKARCVLLTSGTLAPMDSFASEVSSAPEAQLMFWRPACCDITITQRAEDAVRQFHALETHALPESC